MRLLLLLLLSLLLPVGFVVQVLPLFLLLIFSLTLRTKLPHQWLAGQGQAQRG